MHSAALTLLHEDVDRLEREAKSERKAETKAKSSSSLEISKQSSITDFSVTGHEVQLTSDYVVVNHSDRKLVLFDRKNPQDSPQVLPIPRGAKALYASDFPGNIVALSNETLVFVRHHPNYKESVIYTLNLTNKLISQVFTSDVHNDYALGEGGPITHLKVLSRDRIVINGRQWRDAPMLEIFDISGRSMHREQLVSSFVVSPDGRVFFSDGKNICVLAASPDGSSYSRQIVASNVGNFLQLSGYRENQLVGLKDSCPTLWQIAPFKIIRKFDRQVDFIELMPDERHCVIRDRSSNTLLDLETGNELESYTYNHYPNRYDPPPTPLRVSSEGKITYITEDSSDRSTKLRLFDFVHIQQSRARLEEEATQDICKMLSAPKEIARLIRESVGKDYLWWAPVKTKTEILDEKNEATKVIAKK